MSWIPSSHTDVLDGTVILDDFGKIEAYVAAMDDIAVDAAGFQSYLDAASNTAAAFSATTLSAITSKIAGPLSTGRGTVSETADTARNAFNAYAGEVDSIHTQAKTLQSGVDEDLGTLVWVAAAISRIGDEIGVWATYPWDSGPPLTMPAPVRAPVPDDSALDPLIQEQITADSDRRGEWAANAASWHAVVGEITSARAQWAALIESRIAAENRLVGALRETPVGALITLAGTTGSSVIETVAFGVVGEHRGVVATLGHPKTEHDVLVKLLGTSDGSDIWLNPPPANVVADNWAALSPEEQAILISVVPWVIGNLAGLPYSVRNQANQVLLDFYSDHYKFLSPAAQLALDNLQVALTNTIVTTASIVALDLHHDVPLVAVGYGDLDAADTVTWEVPGMKNNADVALGSWDEASRNLFDEQQKLADLLGLGSVGVISFLSYDTPGLSPEVLLPYNANNGAERLAVELDGTQFAQVTSWFDPPRVAVVAHSYGTTTAFAAVVAAKHTIDSMTLVGSAGLKPEDVTAFINQIATDRNGPSIYATLSTKDDLATFGRDAAFRVNPSNIPGVLTFSSDGYTDGDQVFAPTDGHTIIGDPYSNPVNEVFDELFSLSSEGHGYFDSGTQSIRNIAATSMGVGDVAVLGTLDQKYDPAYEFGFTVIDRLDQILNPGKQ